MDRNDGIKIIFLRIEIVFTKIVDQNGFVIRIHDPVFLHTGILIFVKLEQHVLGAGRRGEDLQRKIRSTFKTLCTKVVLFADHKEIGLYHGLVVHIQSDIARGQIDLAFSFVGICALAEKQVKFAQYLLVDDGRRGHVVENAVDQLDTALIRKRIVII